MIGAGFDLDEIARRGSQIYLQMIFTNGYYHADPHPGNIALLPGNVIALLDFGMVGRIQERLREDIEEMLLAIIQNDVALLTSLIKRVGSVPPDLDESGLAADVADFVGVYSTQSLDKFDLAGALNDMMEIIRRYRIALPRSGGHVDQGAGDAGGNDTDAEPAIQSDGGDAAVPSPDVVASSLAGSTMAQIAATADGNRTVGRDSPAPNHRHPGTGPDGHV